MKRVSKGEEPESLRRYRARCPRATWEEMRNDGPHSGREVHEACRNRTLADQGGLCAYCEILLRDLSPLYQRVEHFHPKSDHGGERNWSLEWGNMLGVCNGGSDPHASREGFHLPPLPDNLSCDAHKDRMIQLGKLPAHCEGWILDPCQLTAFPSLFQVHRGTGELRPDADACRAQGEYSPNRHDTLEALVKHTIDMLNLNCDRLNQQRLDLIRMIEKEKKTLRVQGLKPPQAMTCLASKYFQTRWPGFMTTVRTSLGEWAEEHLRAMNYQG